MKIPDAKKLGLCGEYPQIYMISYGCRKILVLWLTGFGDDYGANPTVKCSSVKC
jgi:hypothetical protein